jgi:hypothetical protein
MLLPQGFTRTGQQQVCGACAWLLPQGFTRTGQLQVCGASARGVIYCVYIRVCRTMQNDAEANFSTF